MLERIPVRFGLTAALALLGLGLGLAALIVLPASAVTLHLYGFLLGLSAGMLKVAASAP